MQLNEQQKSVLGLLLEKYENSKTYLGENQVTQSFSIHPTDVFAKYDSDYANMDMIRDFEQQMKRLEKEELITLKWTKHQIDKIVANATKWSSYYILLQKKEKRTIQREQIALYEMYLGTNNLLDCFCNDQIERMQKNQKIKYELQDAKNILELLKYILCNQQDILERELSIAVLGDSKLWKDKYRSRICDLMESYGNHEDVLYGVDDKNERRRILLEEYHIYANPSYVYFKGDADLYFDDGRQFELDINTPIAFTAETLKHLKNIHIKARNVMTVENLTSFHRIHKRDTCYIFLSGYHNTIKQTLIQKIAYNNADVKWFHFGDIDPDGFYIMEHLNRRTGIQFVPMYMDVATLKKYQQFAKPLEKNDIKKAQTLLRSGKYCDVLEYMLESGKKLEQEIVSWMEDMDV